MNRIKDLRKSKNLSQKELADILFVNQTAVSQWEREVTTPTKETLIKLSDFFGVSVDYLLGREDSPNIPYNPDTVAAMEEAFERPEMRALFSVSKNATKEDIEKTIAILKALKGDDYAE